MTSIERNRSPHSSCQSTITFKGYPSGNITYQSHYSRVFPAKRESASIPIEETYFDLFNGSHRYNNATPTLQSSRMETTIRPEPRRKETPLLSLVVGKQVQHPTLAERLDSWNRPTTGPSPPQRAHDHYSPRAESTHDTHGYPVPPSKSYPRKNICMRTFFSNGSGGGLPSKNGLAAAETYYRDMRPWGGQPSITYAPKTSTHGYRFFS